MLNAECRAFRERYERGVRDDHPENCADCRGFVEFIDGLSRLSFNRPLDDRLRTKLRDLPDAEEGRLELIPRVPLLPLPEALHARLRQIARRGVGELPIWIRSPRYAIAASYLLTLLIAGTVGNPAAWAESAKPQIERVGTVWSGIRAGGRETWGGIEERASQGIETTRDFWRSSKSSIKATWQELSESMKEKETTDEEEGSTEELDLSRGESK